MKKKIVFMVINMNIGGTEKALLNMIAEISEEKYDITILMLEEFGGFLDRIPEHVHVKYVDGYEGIKEFLNRSPKETVVNLLKKGKMFSSLNFIFHYLFAKWTRNKGHYFNYLLKSIPDHEQETKYDIAVAYAGPMDVISYFVVYKIKAKRKFQWIHFDVTKIGFDRSFAQKIYQKFDRILIVSEEAKNTLVTALPNVLEKASTFLNVMSPQIICSKGREVGGFDDNYAGLRILTVGRLAIEKGQDLAINVLKKLTADGLYVRWYCLGEGSMRWQYEQQIEDAQLQDQFILLG